MSKRIIRKIFWSTFILLLITFFPSTSTHGLSLEENPTIPTRVISTDPPLRWEDAMLSGNSSTAIMVLGLPLEDTVIVNHEKIGTEGNDYRPQTPALREAWKETKKMAQKGPVGEAAIRDRPAS
ncbi:MAG: hypothetical protein JSV17_10525 [Candidatus Aminicenantes bacterium]|nr:MAG: hypothetical protein JSV17_10525 [Candidatus Aminicenantes bacterium]